MKIRKSAVAGSLAAMSLLVAPLAATAAEPDATTAANDPAGDVVTLDLYNLTDIHGHIEQAKGKDGKVTQAGLSAVGCYLDNARMKNPNSSFTLLGDNIGASTFTSGTLNDNPTIASLNLLGPVASTLGNHELDLGSDTFKKRVDGVDPYTKIEFPYLGANVEGMGNYLHPYEIWTSPSGVNVGFIGAIANDVKEKVTPGSLDDLDFKPPIDIVNNTAKELKESGKADVVIAMLDDDAKNNYPKMGQYVDGLMGGDTHVPYAFTDVQGAEGNTLSAVASGSYTDNLGQLTITYNTTTKKVESSKAVNIPASTVAECGDSPAVKAVVDKAVQDSETAGNQVIATGYDKPFYRGAFASEEGGEAAPGTNRGVESTLGSLIADSMRNEITVDAQGTKVDIGIINAGGIRADLVPNDKGEITVRQVYEVAPFSNELGFVTITGKAVEDMLEQQWKVLENTSQDSRPMLKLGISSNVSYTYDATRPYGERITSVTIDGKPLDKERTYTVGSVTFLLGGGDSFPALTTGGAAHLISGLDREHFAHYLTQNQGKVQPRALKSSTGVTLPTGTVKNGEKITVALRGLSFTEGDTFPKTASVTVGGMAGTAEINNSLVEPNNNNEKSIITTDGAGQASVEVTVDAAARCNDHAGETVAVPVTVSTDLGEVVAESAGLTVSVECAKANMPQPSGTQTPAPTETDKAPMGDKGDKDGKPQADGKNQLAHTGADALTPGILALALLALGGATVLVRRRTANKH